MSDRIEELKSYDYIKINDKFYKINKEKFLDDNQKTRDQAHCEDCRYTHPDGIEVCTIERQEMRLSEKKIVVAWSTICCILSVLTDKPVVDPKELFKARTQNYFHLKLKME